MPLLATRLLLLACCLLPLFSQAQSPARFSDNPNEFVDQLGEFMTATKRPDLEESFSVFKKMVKARSFSDADMARVTKVANMLADQKLSQYPYFKNYINAVNAARSNPDTALFNRWIGFTEKALAGIERGRTRPITLLLEFSADLM
ncbi:MAG: hypothetical protein ABIO24_10955, partial [Saprospiraceae bacterium]